MHEAQGNETIKYAGREMIPAAFDMREILRSSAKTLRQIKEVPENSLAPWENLLSTPKAWQSLEETELKAWAKRYQDEFSNLVSGLDLSQQNLQRWIRKAEWMTKKNDEIRGQSKLKSKELDLQGRISKGKGNVKEWSREAIELAKELEDNNRPERVFNSLYPKRSCSELMKGVLP